MFNHQLTSKSVVDWRPLVLYFIQVKVHLK